MKKLEIKKLDIKDLNSKKEKAVKYFIYFLIFMLFCTIVSRAIYAMRLPRIMTDKVKPGNIAHEVKAEGIVQAKDREAIWTESDLRVAKVFVKEGENIETGTQLFQIETDDLNEKIKALQEEITQQKAQLNATQQNENIEKKDRQTAINRANEDKQTSLASADAAVTKAQNELNTAQLAIDNYPSKETSTNKTEWESNYQMLQQTLQEKKDALNEALLARKTAETTANRAIEDANKQSASEISDSSTKRTLEENQKLLDKYETIKKSDGIITSETAGRISKLNVAVGESTPANAAVIVETAGDTVAFVATITKEDKMYLEDEADIVLKFDEQTYNDYSVKEIVPVTDESGAATDSYEVTIELPSTVAEIGKIGEMTATKTSDLYQSTVPLSAIYTDGTGYYVYILQKKDTILGEEITVVQRAVDIKEKNSTLVALDSSAGLEEGDSIVISSTKELSAGATVRLLEE